MNIFIVGTFVRILSSLLFGSPIFRILFAFHRDFVTPVCLFGRHLASLGILSSERVRRFLEKTSMLVFFRDNLWKRTMPSKIL